MEGVPSVPMEGVILGREQRKLGTIDDKQYSDLKAEYDGESLTRDSVKKLGLAKEVWKT